MPIPMRPGGMANCTAQHSLCTYTLLARRRLVVTRLRIHVQSHDAACVANGLLRMEPSSVHCLPSCRPWRCHVRDLLLARFSIMSKDCLSKRGRINVALVPATYVARLRPRPLKTYPFAFVRPTPGEYGADLIFHLHYIHLHSKGHVYSAM